MKPPDHPPTEEEVREAEALRAALDGEAPYQNDDAQLLHALVVAHRVANGDPRSELDADENERLIEAAIAQASRTTKAEQTSKETPKLRSVPMPQKAKPAPARKQRPLYYAAVVLLPLAAAFLLWVRFHPVGRPDAAPQLPGESLAASIQARSTQDLFEQPFKRGERAARIDRIASARASDYRENRYARWGAR